MSFLEFETLSEAILKACQDRHWMIATAESCTGGMIAAALTDIAGSSAVVERGFVTYSNQAKQDMLSVPSEMITSFGAVSTEVATAMALGALQNSPAHLALSVTGIAGPGGATKEKPVGLVHFGLARRDHTENEPILLKTEKHIFKGDRTSVRLQTLGQALSLLRHAAG